MTLNDIAKEAGVSTSTVHRVLRGKNDVSLKTIKLVKSVMKEIGYPPEFKEQVDSRELFNTGCIGLLLVEKPVELLKVPFFVKLLSGIEQALADYDLMLTVMQVSDPEREYPMLSEERLDGLLIFGEPKSEFLREKFEAMHSVGLLTSEHFENNRFDWVSSDFKSRGIMAVRYLVDRGHRRIAFFNPMPNHMGFEETGFHFRRSAVEADVSITMLVSEKQFTLPFWTKQAGQSHIESLVDKFVQMPAEDRPTGIHVVNDEICISVYEEMQKRGIKVGEEVEIISCGNHEEFLSRMDPRPATMDLNIEEIARRAVEKLIYRIKNPEAIAGVVVQVPPQIIPT